MKRYLLVHRSIFCFAIVYILVFASCSFGFTAMSTPTVVPGTEMPTPAQIQTLRSLPTPVNVFDYPDQVTDGKLLLSISEIEKVCHNINVPFQIRFSFTNVTDKEINLPDNFSVAANRRGDGGNLIPLMMTLTGAEIYSLADFNIVDIFETPSNSFTILPASQTVDFVIDFRFPDPLAELQSDGSKKLLPPKPGQYIIRFIHVQYPREIDTWSGVLGSNRLEICMAN